MNCPLCLDQILDVTYHAGIELDICPQCRGVWLDRGELNRIVAEMGARPNDRSPARGEFRPHRDDGRHTDRGRKKRKQSFASRLGDVFEEIVDL